LEIGRSLDLFCGFKVNFAVELGGEEDVFRKEGVVGDSVGMERGDGADKIFGDFKGEGLIG